MNERYRKIALRTLGTGLTVANLVLFILANNGASNSEQENFELQAQLKDMKTQLDASNQRNNGDELVSCMLLNIMREEKGLSRFTQVQCDMLERRALSSPDETERELHGDFFPWFPPFPGGVAASVTEQ